MAPTVGFTEEHFETDSVKFTALDMSGHVRQFPSEMRDLEGGMSPAPFFVVTESLSLALGAVLCHCGLYNFCGRQRGPHEDPSGEGESRDAEHARTVRMPFVILTKPIVIPYSG